MGRAGARPDRGHRHGELSGISVTDTRPGQPGWTLTGQATDFVNGATTAPAADFGWIPALLAPGSDAEGAPLAGPAVPPRMQSPQSGGLAVPGATLASAPPGSGLGTQHVGAAMALWLPDTAPTGTYTSLLTITLIGP
ncbi:hypothetical protein [Dactylosporangium sp. CA-233914]|uniref:hypothetical protein n=1 Tax=Dactylosporangium sp. CA-233914 TaxID=3239934 RepID=UPI003D8ED8D1